MAKQKPASEAEVIDRRQTLLEGQDFTNPVVEELDAPPAATEEPGSEPVEPVAAEAATDLEAPTPEEEVSPFLQAARQAGYQGQDEQEAALTMLEQYQQLQQQSQTYEQRMQELEELAQYGNQFLRQQREEQQKQQAAAEPETPQREPWWNPPKFDAKWIEQYRDVTVGPDGQPEIGWKKSTPREVQDAAGAYQQYLEQWATDLVQRPQEVLPKVIEQEFDRLFETRIRERDEAAQMSSFAERVRETNRDWMYARDGQGREVLTEAGQVMTRLLGEVAENGVTNPQLQWQYAVAMYDYLNRANQAAVTDTTAAAKETAAQKRRQQLQRGVTQPTHNRTGTVPRPDEAPTRAQNPNLSPGQQLLQTLRQDGVDFG